jgi:hypothetical protein
MPQIKRRRDTEAFSLSFLDCICCGFGAIILIFILTVAERRSVARINVDDLDERVRRMETQVATTRNEVERVERLLAAAQAELPALQQKTTNTELKLTDRQRQLLAMLEQTGKLREALASLLEQKKSLPTVDQSPIPIPEVDRRQYLTGVKLEGECVLFIVRTSGSMLGETVEEASAMLEENETSKREAPKWQRALRSLEWMIASLDEKTRFQVLLFNEDASLILPDRGDEWFSINDRQTLKQVVVRLREIVPGGSANLERAFFRVRTLSRLPDAIVLITDGLPTASDSFLSEGATNDEQRIRFFREAVRGLPERIPVSTILMPMSGDPAAPALFWELANRTRGALVSPARSWPEA